MGRGSGGRGERGPNLHGLPLASCQPLVHKQQERIRSPYVSSAASHVTEPRNASVCRSRSIRRQCRYKDGCISIPGIDLSILTRVHSIVTPQHVINAKKEERINNEDGRKLFWLTSLLGFSDEKVLTVIYLFLLAIAVFLLKTSIFHEWVVRIIAVRADTVTLADLKLYDCCANNIFCPELNAITAILVWLVQQAHDSSLRTPWAPSRGVRSTEVQQPTQITENMMRCREHLSPSPFDSPPSLFPSLPFWHARPSSCCCLLRMLCSFGGGMHFDWGVS